VKLFKALSVAVTAAGLCVTAFAADDSKAMTITGCFDKGSSAGEYKLTDSNGKSWTVMAASHTNPDGGAAATSAGSPDLDKHAMRHTVKLTGKQDATGGQTIFRAEKVEHVSDNCSNR
jgi:hypothetical protein